MNLENKINTNKAILPMPLPPKTLELVGISERQIKEHYYILYMSYVENINEIRHKLNTVDKKDTDAIYSEFRQLKAGESHAINGVLLHELYFQNLGNNYQRPDGVLLHAIESDFGSYEKWKDDFVATGLSSRGWSVLSYDNRDKRLHNYILDSHNKGVVVSAYPLLILDVYEHAYFIDYGARRHPYINAFMRNIDWGIVQSRFKRTRNYQELSATKLWGKKSGEYSPD